MSERYDILCKDKILYKNLGQLEYFEVMEDLAIEYYQTGSPNPSELETKIYEVKNERIYEKRELCGFHTKEDSSRE